MTKKFNFKSITNCALKRNKVCRLYRTPLPPPWLPWLSRFISMTPYYLIFTKIAAQMPLSWLCRQIKTIFLGPVPPCFTLNEGMGGFFLDTLTAQKTALECQIVCYNTAGCQFFQFNQFSSGFYCHLFQTKTSAGCGLNCTTGPKICP